MVGAMDPVGTTNISRTKSQVTAQIPARTVARKKSERTRSFTG
jgi:hypothetical protein